MHAGGRATLASVSDWGSRKVNYVSNIAVKETFLEARLLHRILTQPHAQMLSISNVLNPIPPGGGEGLISGADIKLVFGDFS